MINKKVTIEAIRERLCPLREESRDSGRFDMHGHRDCTPEIRYDAYLHNNDILYKGLAGYGYADFSRPIIDFSKGNCFCTYMYGIEQSFEVILDCEAGYTTCELIFMIGNYIYNNVNNKIIN